MKLSILLLVAGLLQVSAKGYGQITLNEKQSTLEKVLLKIEKQTHYNFIYDENKLNVSEITVKVDHVSIEAALDACFRNLPVIYTIIDNNIILKRKDLITISPPAANAPDPPVPPASVSGMILNEDNKPVEGATVLIKGTYIGTITNVKGYFRLDEVTDNAVLRITSIGYRSVEIGIRKVKNTYKAYAIEKEQAENLRSEAGTDVNITLRLITAVSSLTEASVKADATKQAGTVVDLKHRSHLNLGQVLEGSIPGLTLKNTTTTSQDISVNGANYGPFAGIYSGIEQLKVLYSKMTANDPALRGVYPTFDRFYKHLYAVSSLAAGGNPFGIQMVTSTTNNGLVPELRGSSSFTGNTAGMLVVIDGVEQNSFPASYPMNNVAKIEVIKDPAELVKWGAKATAGLVLITTNGAKAGKLQFNYSTNFYYSDKPDISNSKLQLAPAADILAYYKEQVDKGLASYIPSSGDYSFPPTGLKPAQWLLYNLKKRGLPYTDPQFRSSWDSLASLSNRDQLRLLYQDALMQSHSLNIAGGTRTYHFNLGGIYENSRSSTMGDKTTNLNLNLQNIFNLFQNKLRITWQLNTINSNNQSKNTRDGSSLDPYQLLLDPRGNYVYDYSGKASDSVNSVMQQLGYLNYGVNPLEDARNTQNNNKTAAINSRMNIDWDLSQSLKWSTAFVYNRSTGRNRSLEAAATSFVRQLRDDYGSPDSAGVTFYVPPGGILNTSGSKSMDWNLRSGLSYNHNFDARNVLSGAFGMAAAATQNSIVPNASLYGYERDNPAGLPFLTPPESGIINYFGAAQYLSQLLVPGFNTAAYNRSFALNGNLAYSYDSRYTLNMQYGSVYTPNAGFDPSYSGTRNYEAAFTWQVSKEHFFKLPFISSLNLSAIASKIQLGRAPDQIRVNPLNQPSWNNTTLFADGYTPSQLNGQEISNIGGALQIGLRQERIQIQAGYNHSSDGSNQINGQVVYELSREPWFNIPFVSRLVLDASLQNFNALQAQAIVMGTNAPNADGGFSLASNNNFGILPPATINKEAHLSLGLFKDRVIFDMRYYHKIISSSSGSGLLPPDPSTGLLSQLSYSRIMNKGMELYLRGKIVQGKDFSYGITVNGAYNVNQALDIPDIPFSPYSSYLTALHAGYATDALWSYRWAGLDPMGNPQVYKDKDTKMPVLSGTDANGVPITTTLDASSLVYSGRTRAPWSGGLIHEWQYKDFFASARLVFNLGYIVRTYIPVAGPLVDKNLLIGQRWEKPGDEAHTDIAAMAQADATRGLVIQNSSNSIVPADNIRLREIQFGYEVPANVFKKSFVKALTISAQVENVALWTRNKLGIDPDAIASNGTVGIPLPRQYVLTINASF